MENDVKKIKIAINGGIGFGAKLNSKAKGKDAEIGSMLMDKLTPEELYDTVEKIISVYSQMGKKRATFYNFLKRIGREQLIS
ncbi:hypothetical protein [Bacillus sp. MRMR6]|uniref:hypothetical protein n=1 Tax=Bacillus sp. MRMR6 TaxID=1928617 RepID=UPI000AE6F274|nr:hypothetical protein [Bacillus sp. MRMR6]